VNFSTEGSRKKSSKEGKCAVSFFDDKEFYQASLRKCLEARSNDSNKQGNGNKLNAVEARLTLRKVSTLGFEPATCKCLYSDGIKNLMFVLPNEG